MSAKANSLALELKDALTQQGFTVTTSFDTDGQPLIRVGTAGVGNQTALIKIDQVAPLGTTSEGGTAREYTPHIAQIVLETSATANLALMLEASELLLFCTVAKFGMRVELYMSANGNATGVEDIVAGNLKNTWHPSPKYKQLSSQ